MSLNLFTAWADSCTYNDTCNISWTVSKFKLKTRFQQNLQRVAMCTFTISTGNTPDSSPVFPSCLICSTNYCNFLRILPGPCTSIHLAVCLTTGPKPLPNRALHIVRSRASSFRWEYPLLSIRSSSSFLHLLPRLPFTSIHPFIFPSITCCRRQFLRKMWPIQLAFRLLISCRIFLCSLTASVV
jgi:hypothetical protein